ncbi:ribonuclease P/MRP protein subunit POP5 [Striga asiatica]|uniref:Ribonuclease P/MRP protein subunit POP5 n=1 Tax=Striga asiatica TaxID=4170 RepID=A0A5A7QN45_STRAF|nr:ribonuclease P/MRP protein subunit POP5 [Striga asiatica]
MGFLARPNNIVLWTLPYRAWYGSSINKPFIQSSNSPSPVSRVHQRLRTTTDCSCTIPIAVAPSSTSDAERPPRLPPVPYAISFSAPPPPNSLHRPRRRAEEARYPICGRGGVQILIITKLLFCLIFELGNPVMNAAKKCKCRMTTRLQKRVWFDLMFDQLLRRNTMVGFKNRYMVMEVFLDPSKDFSIDDPIIITQFNLSKAVKDSILTNFGECGLASCMSSFQGIMNLYGSSSLSSGNPFLAVKYVNPITKVCIFRTSREDYQKVWAAITMVKSIGTCPVVFNLLDLSGSIRACRNAALKCDESKFEQYKLLAGDRISSGTHQQMQNCLEKIKVLEH